MEIAAKKQGKQSIQQRKVRGDILNQDKPYLHYRGSNGPNIGSNEEWLWQGKEVQGKPQTKTNVVKTSTVNINNQ